MTNILSPEEFSSFMNESPLYSKVLLGELYNDITLEPEHPYFDATKWLDQKSYQFYCPKDKSETTFRLEAVAHEQRISIDRTRSEEFLTYGKMLDGKRLSIPIFRRGCCQLCGYRMTVTFNIESDTRNDENMFTKLFLSKIGQFPAFKRQPDKDVLMYLTEEDANFYVNALANLSVGYGIGAMTYFRRITENEIKRIVQDISELDYADAPKVRSAWQNYLKNHQMSGLLESIYPFLPSSLRENGGNPLRVLYDATSDNLHSNSDEEAALNGKHVDKLLSYVIKRVKALKDELKEVHRAMSQLTKRGK